MTEPYNTGRRPKYDADTLYKEFDRIQRAIPSSQRKLGFDALPSGSGTWDADVEVDGNVDVTGDLAVEETIQSTLAPGYGLLLGNTDGGGDVHGWYADSTGLFLRNTTESEAIRFQIANDGEVTFPTGGVSIRAGTSASAYRPALVLYQNYGLSTTSVTDVSLASFSLPANALSANGQKLRIEIVGTSEAATGSGDDNGEINIVFGATQVAAAPLTVTIGLSFHIVIHIVRTGAATQLAYGLVNRLAHGGSSVPYITRSTPAETLSGAVTIDFRGEAEDGGTTNGTLRYDSIIVEHLA